MKIFRILVSGFFLLTAFSCGSGTEREKMEKLPYFDLAGFIDLETSKLDGVDVIKTSRVNGKEEVTEVKYSLADWKEEMESFYMADINTTALALSYSTDAKFDYLIHELLPEAKGKVKEIRVTYSKNYPTRISFKMSEENLFFKSYTFGDLAMNSSTGTIDHYSIESTQKVWFLKPTNIRISGVVKS